MNPDRLQNPASKSRLVTVPSAAPINTSGIEPIGQKVLILPDKIGMKSAGGIIIPESTKEQNEFAVTTGTLVACGGGAFTDWPNSDSRWPGATPTAGQRIVYAKYQGVVIEGRDGKRYRLAYDTDVVGMET